MIGITGASGALGKALMRRFPGSLAIGRVMPTVPVDLLIHAAAPDWRDPIGVDDFRWFNDEVRDYVHRYGPQMVNVGSWWQYATGPVSDLSHTRVKRDQQEMFPAARHVIAYSIFGPDKGFNLSILDHLSGAHRMGEILPEWRDFIHVDDVADAVAWATGLVPGAYAACSGDPVRLGTVARSFGIDLPPADPLPNSADLTYPLENIAATTVHLAEFIAHDIATRAEQVWVRQSREWKAA
jgi:hypothetical protein